MAAEDFKAFFGNGHTCHTHIELAALNAADD